MKIAKYRSITGVPISKEFEDLFSGFMLHNFASDLLSFGIENDPDLYRAVTRGMAPCRAAEISVSQNFNEIFVS